MIDYLTLEEAAFKRYCDTEDILGDNMTQDVRDYLLDEVSKHIGRDSEEWMLVRDRQRSAKLAEAEVINSIDLL